MSSQAQASNSDNLVTIGGAKKSAPVTGGVKNVKHVIAIASGKGGVGKSTLTSNLAVAMRYLGANVALMDGDVYGPSQTKMLGAMGERAQVAEERLLPLRRHGIDFMSLGLLMADDGPVIWRAPMATQMISQFIHQVQWGSQDYLFIDLPPGTGDVQLTLTQTTELGGVIVVTTPQEVALGIAKKGLQMFERVNVPVLGIIENMSGFTCGHCGESTAIFKMGGGRQLAEECGVPFLGAVPLDPAIMESGESGVPIVENASDSAAAKIFIELATAVQKRVQDVVDNPTAPDRMALSEGGGRLQVWWKDGHAGFISARRLRLNCACAECVHEQTGERLLKPTSVSETITLASYRAVGRYAIAPQFSDSHKTGIFPHETVRAMCECSECKANVH